MILLTNKHYLFFENFSGVTSAGNEHAVYPWRGDHVDFAYILEFIGVKEADYLGRFSELPFYPIVGHELI